MDELQEPENAASKPENVTETAICGDIDFLRDIPLEVSVELGRTRISISDLLKMGRGSLIELPKPSGDPLEIYANKRLIAKGETVVVNGKYGIRITEIVKPEDSAGDEE